MQRPRIVPEYEYKYAAAIPPGAVSEGAPQGEARPSRQGVLHVMRTRYPRRRGGRMCAGRDLGERDSHHMQKWGTSERSVSKVLLGVNRNNRKGGPSGCRRSGYLV